VTWPDALALAWRSMRRRSGRAVLTILAVALAAALLTALLMIAQTAKTRVVGQLTHGGPLATIRVEGSALGLGDVRRLERLPDVQAVLPVAVAQEIVVPPNPPVYSPGVTPSPPTLRGEDQDGANATDDVEPFESGIVGIDLRHPEAFPVSVLAGRLPASGAATEVAVTADYLTRVGVDRDRPISVLGTTLQIGAPKFLGSSFSDGVLARWTKSTIVGVVAQEAGSGEILASTADVLAAQSFEGLGPDASLPPLPGSGRGVATPEPSGNARGATFAAFLVQARSLDSVGEALDEIGRLGYATSAPENLIVTVERYLRVLQLVLSSIGVIALGIAGLGIANALLAAIRERRREIGVMKAIGARDRDVRRVFLIEAGLLGAVGGLIGALTGWALAKTVAALVNRYLQTQGLVGVRLVAPTTVVLGAVAGATVLSLLAGLVPSMRAASLPAREAMGDL
jgi:hypothetical protein